MTSPVFDRLTALSEPIRVRLLRVLAREELAVGELARVLQTSQPTVSRHLKQLDEGGWVLRRKAGTASYFRLVSQDLDSEARMLWELVHAQVELEATDPASQYAEDLRRLEGVVAARAADSEELFRRLGGQWDAVRKDLFGDGYVLPALLALLPAGQVIADLGCGTGAMLPLLAPVAHHVYGIDREAAMLEVAEARARDLSNVTLRRGLLDALPLEAASVDLALCELVLHHVRELEAVYFEVARVLTPGGQWVILDMVEHDREDYRDTMGHQHLGFSEAGIRAAAAHAGLIVRGWRVLPPDPAAQGPALFVAVLLKPGSSSGLQASENPSILTEMSSSRRPRMGFSIVELMLTVMIIGVLALIAVPTFQTMALKARKSEALTNLRGIGDSAVAHFVSSDTWVAAALNPDAALGKKPRDWEHGEPGWRELGWSPDGQVRCSYELTVDDGMSALAEAFCDVDDDGEPAVLEYEIPSDTREGLLRDLSPFRY